MRRLLVGCLFGGFFGAGLVSTAAATSLVALLAAVAHNAAAVPPVRGNLTITRGDQRTTGVLLGWRHTWYLETTTGFRALVRPTKQVVVRNGHPVRAPIRTQVPGTDLLLEELPFEGALLKFPQIHDESPEGVVVGGESASPSLYVLLVRTIDPARNVVVESKYYKDDIATLVKVRRDTDFTDLDAHARPQTVTVEDYLEHSTTRLGIAWQAAPELPATLFAPSALRRPSGLLPTPAT